MWHDILQTGGGPGRHADGSGRLLPSTHACADGVPSAQAFQANTGTLCFQDGSFESKSRDSSANKDGSECQKRK